MGYSGGICNRPVDFPAKIQYTIRAVKNGFAMQSEYRIGV